MDLYLCKAKLLATSYLPCSSLSQTIFVFGRRTLAVSNEMHYSLHSHSFHLSLKRDWAARKACRMSSSIKGIFYRISLAYLADIPKCS